MENSDNIVRLYINSVNRTSGSNESFNIKLNQQVRNIKKITVKSVQIPISMYPINSSNNTLLINEASGPTLRTITLTNGHFTGSDFAAMLTTQINAVTSGYTATYNQNTAKFTITRTSGNFQLVQTSGGSSTTCDNLIGYRAAGATTSGLTFTSDSIADGTSGVLNHIFIMSNVLSSQQRMIMSDNRVANIFRRVVIDQSFGAVVNDKIDAYNATSLYYSNLTLDSIDLQLVNEQFVQIDLNGLNWNIELELETGCC